MDYQDKLHVETENLTLDFDISFGYLDRSYSVFNFEEEKKESVYGYSVSVNADSLDIKTYRELEKILNEEKKLHNIFLCLDGIIKKGKARIAQRFGASGLNLDIEVYEQ